MAMLMTCGRAVDEECYVDGPGSAECLLTLRNGKYGAAGTTINHLSNSSHRGSKASGKRKRLSRSACAKLPAVCGVCSSEPSSWDNITHYNWGL